MALAAKVQAASDYDLAITQTDLEFLPETLIVGQKVRIYARVQNTGLKDITGYVSFFQNAKLIGNSQPVSVRPGRTDDVFVDFIVPDQTFNIEAKVQGTEPADQNAANDATQTKVITPDKDTDSDGTVDRLDKDDDNDGLSDDEEKTIGTDPLKIDSDGDGYNDKADLFPLAAKEWADTDADGQGNNADIDDDNDGLSDAQEQAKGTDPLRRDTDSDGVIDSQDFYPLDAKRSVEEKARDIFQSPAKPSPAEPAAALTNSSPEVKNLADLQKQLNDLTSASATVSKLAESVPERLTDVIEKVSVQAVSFWRLNNFFLWLIALLILVLAVLIFLFWRSQKKEPKNLDALAQADSSLAAVHPALPQESLRQDQKLPPNVINLKDFIKKRNK